MAKRKLPPPLATAGEEPEEEVSPKTAVKQLVDDDEFLDFAKPEPPKRRRKPPPSKSQAPPPKAPPKEVKAPPPATQKPVKTAGNRTAAANAANDIIPLLRQLFTRDHLELEAKLGKWIGTHFESGVSKEDFDRIQGMLSSYRGWTNQDDLVGPGQGWSITFDYMLDNDVRCTKSCRGNAFIRKTLVDHQTFECPARPYDIRVSLKEEVPTEVRVPGVPHLVRVKRRRSFIYKKRLRYDLTIVWTGKDEQAAQSEPPTYEVELECMDRHALGQDHRYTASSLLEKMLDFLPAAGGVAGPLVSVVR